MDLEGLVDYFQTENPEIDGRKNQKEKKKKRKHSEKRKSEVIDEGQERPIKKSRSNENKNCSDEDSDSDVFVLGHFRNKSRPQEDKFNDNKKVHLQKNVKPKSVSKHSLIVDDQSQPTVKPKTVSKQPEGKVDNIGNKVVNRPQKKKVDVSDAQPLNDDRTHNNKETKARKR